MNLVAFLALVAFIPAILQNHVDAAGKCYACSPNGTLPPRLGIGTCDEFASATASYRKSKFVVDSKTSFSVQLDCSRCLRQKEKEGKIIVRSCAQLGVDFCEGDFCNGPSNGTNANANAKSLGSTGKCYACGRLPLEGFNVGNCDSFDTADEDERKQKFMMDSKTPKRSDADCSKCVTFSEEGEVKFRSCSLTPGWDICKGDLCNGGGSFKSGALLASVVPLLKGSLF